MIAKVGTGSGFLGVMLYVLHGSRDQVSDKHAHIVGGNMAGDTARTLSREFGQLRKLRPNLGKAVSHFSLSFSPEERPLSDDELAGIADEFMHAMGYEKSAYVSVRHHDTEHQHIHIIGCRATTDGKTVSDAHSFRRAEAVARQLENKHGLLQLTPTTTVKEKKNMTNDDNQKQEYDKQFVDQRPLVEAEIWAECGEEASPRKARELRRLALSEDYRQRIVAAFGPSFKGMNKTAYGLVISTTNGGRISDKGDRVTAHRMNPDEAASLMVAIGLAKGWPSIRFAGSPEFLRLAFMAAAEAGIQVIPQDEEQRQLFGRVAEELRQRTYAKAAAMQAMNATEPTTEVAREAKPERGASKPAALSRLNGMGGLNARLLAIREASEQRKEEGNRFNRPKGPK